MLCKKCRKEIPDGSIYCNYCGKKQEATKRKTRRRARGTGTIRFDQRNGLRHYLAYAPKTISGAGEDILAHTKHERRLRVLSTNISTAHKFHMVL